LAAVYSRERLVRKRDSCFFLRLHPLGTHWVTRPKCLLYCCYFFHHIGLLIEEVFGKRKLED
jgi:hypothetical protein